MASKKAAVVVLPLVLAALVALFVWLSSPVTDDSAAPASTASATDQAASLTADPQAAKLTAGAEAAAGREAVQGLGGGGAKVRGRVLDGWTLQPLGGVEVLAVTTLPNFERLEARFRGTMMGTWKADPAPPRVLGTTLSQSDGSFELTGLPSGRVFLDGRSDRYYVRTPASVRLAGNETSTDVELLCFAGGRVRGRVLGPEGTPVAGAGVSLRPGPNAFLGQITQRKYRWLEGTTDAEGYYDIRGVPEGHGYTVSASASQMALVEAHGISVREGATTSVDLQGLAGATLLGRVVGPDGEPMAGAQVAMVYMDISRVLFSRDGRGEPIESDAEGRFVLTHVAPGLIALAAAKDGVAPSRIEQLQVVDGGRYDDLTLELGVGATLNGLVVDESDKPIADALVEVVPMERPQDPDVVKMVLSLREVTARSGRDGKFSIAGLSGERLFVQVSKPGYVTRVQFGIKLDQELKVKLEHGATVRGRVLADSGEPIARFRVETRSREARDDGAAPAEGDREAMRRSMRGFGPGGRPREAGMRLQEGKKISERRPGDEWQELQNAEGRFELAGLPPGKIRVRVCADGWLDAEAQEVTLTSGQTSDELVFKLKPGLTVHGVVLDAVTGRPVPEAQVTAYREREAREGGRGPMQFGGDPEDFDFLGMSSMRGRNSALTDGQGQFTLSALTAGKYRFTARHPDRAKASATAVEILEGKEPPKVEIKLTAGGAVEGLVTGRAGVPVVNALIVAATLSGGMKSAATGPDGMYRIEGIPPGRYLVFKSRLEENATNLLYDLLGNMRLQTVTVKEGEVVRKDIQDETENSVRVWGVVRDGNEVVSRAMVTALGQDNDGIFGLGLRAKPTNERGEYELIGLKPGSYFLQVARFNQRPEQVSLSVDIPEGTSEYRLDLQLPQSHIAGRVVDTTGQPVVGVSVAAAMEDGGEQASGLLGMILRNGVNRARTDKDGNFKLTRVPEGRYRVTAGSRGMGPGQRGGGGQANATKYGEARSDAVMVDGRTPIDNVLITLPLAGKVRGVVRDGNGAPVAGVDIGYALDGQRKRTLDNELMDLFGAQRRPLKSGADGTFVVEGLTPGSYTFSADLNDKTAEPARDVIVAENGEANVTLTLIRGATLRIRIRNIDGSLLRPGDVQIVDSKGQAVTSRMSAASVFRRFMGNQQKKDDSGWREIGNVAPDTYTVIVSETGKPERRYTREIKDGETVEWDVDMAAVIKAETGGK